VLIAPHVIGQPDWASRKFPVDLTREQVKDSPDIDADLPVSRQQELALREHYQWPLYWSVPLTPTPPASVALHEAQTERIRKQIASADPNLRRIGEVIGYKMEGRDGTLGVVDDFIVEDDSWIIRYLVLDTQEWLSGKQVLIAPHFWIQEISYDASKVSTDLLRQHIIDSPDFDPAEPINREYEITLYDYYGRPYYWN
jgi:hypothetical protein